MSNGTRFISAYNRLDNALRKRYNLKSNMTFPEVIRISGVKNSMVRKHEDDLFDYGRLRNAIVHKSDSDMIIAEPHDSVVETIEKIAELVAMPPRADKTVAKPAVAFNCNTSLYDAVRLMAKSNFSNVPVLNNGEIVGVINNKIIVESISKVLDTNINDFLKNSSIGSVLHGENQHYAIASNDVTIDVVLTMFLDSPKLQIVLLTLNGAPTTPLTGVITTGDLTTIHQLLD